VIDVDGASAGWPIDLLELEGCGSLCNRKVGRAVARLMPLNAKLKVAV